jgi:Holliday junction resolvase-like predicted endonuclease
MLGAARRRRGSHHATEALRDAARGERLAARHLRRCGHRILARNLRVGHDEADLVTLPEPGEPLLAIVEVKTSRRDPAEALLRVDPGKRRRLSRMAERLLARPEFSGLMIRFDCVGVDLRSEPPAIEHRPNAFAANWPIPRVNGDSARWRSR